MSTVYIVSNNGKMSVDNGLLIYSDYTKTVTKLIPSKVDQIIVLGRMELSGSAFHVIMDHGINVIFLHKDGRYCGQMNYSDSKNTILRHRQHQLYENKEFSFLLAKNIVRGKLHNEFLFMQRINRKFPYDGQIKNSIHEMGRIRERLEHSSDINEVRGYEGIGANLYFGVYGKNIESKGITFNGRNKNPPKDPVNSVLSLLYTILANKIQTILIMEGLDPSIGSLHTLAYGRNSLVFDLIEEFRTPIVDTLTCSLFNMGTLNLMSFYEGPVFEESDANEEYQEMIVQSQSTKGIFIVQDAIKKIITQFEKKLETTHMYPDSRIPITYENIIHKQVVQYKRVISGIEKEYKPMVVV